MHDCLCVYVSGACVCRVHNYVCCVYVRVGVHPHTYTHAHAYTHNTHTHTHTHTHMHIHTHAYTCVHNMHTIWMLVSLLTFSFSMSPSMKCCMWDILVGPTIDRHDIRIHHYFLTRLVQRPFITTAKKDNMNWYLATRISWKIAKGKHGQRGGIGKKKK